MSKLPPSAVLLATLSASIGVIVTDAPAAIFGLGAPALLGVLASERGRRSFGRRLLPTGPLVAVAIALRWFGHAQPRDLLLFTLRVVSAIAWSSCLSALLTPRETRAALGSLGAPRALVELIAHTHRFAVQLAATTSEAWHAATLRAGLHSLRATTGTIGSVAGVIVVRAFDRAESVAIAGALRGNHLSAETPHEECRASQDRGVSA